MLVLVGAKWCPACVQMKNSVVPQLKKRGSLSQVAFAQVDIDQEHELGRQLVKGGAIPQLLMYRNTDAGWRVRRVIGGRSVQQVEDFIAEGIALDEATKKRETHSTSQADAGNAKPAPGWSTSEMLVAFVTLCFPSRDNDKHAMASAGQF
jgi:thioredoxin-like negative regulator of GroEL